MPRFNKKSSRRPRSRKAPKVSNNIKNYVSRAISRNTENKRITETLTYTNFNNVLSGSGDILTLLPQISQGDASYQRQGTKIRIKKMVIRGVLNWTGSATAGLQRVGVRQMIVKSKRFPNSMIQSNSTELNYLLEASGGSYQSFAGTNFDSLFQPINRKAWAVARDKKHYMYAQSTAQSTDDMSHSSKFFTIDLKQARNKIINYEFESGTVTNWGWYMLLGFQDLLGGAVANTNTNLSMNYTVDIIYEDA